MTPQEERTVAIVEEAVLKIKATVQQREDLAYNQGRLDAKAEAAPYLNRAHEIARYWQARYDELLQQVVKNSPLMLEPSIMAVQPRPAPPYDAVIDDVGAIPNSVRSNT